MGEVVRGNFAILYAKLGAVYYPIACTKDVAIDTDAEALERAPYTNNEWREYEYGRKTGTITGSGLTVINTAPDNLYTVFDLHGYQLASQKLMVKFSLEDPDGNLKVYECRTLITKVGLAKTAGKMVDHSYSLLMDGPPRISSTPVENTNPQILVYEYIATGGESEITLPFGDNVTILLVEIDGDGSVRVAIAPDGYGPGEVQYDTGTKELAFGDAPLAAGTYVRILYIDVDTLIPADARTTGDGEYRTTGDGEYRTTG
jgi:hypothetical protein